MSEVVYVSGFANPKHETRKVAADIASFFDKDVEGLSLLSAMNTFPGYFEGKSMVTHSGGLLVADRAHPAEVIAVAPPVPMPLSRLIRRGIALGKEQGKQPGTDKLELTNRTEYELLCHPIANSRVLREISQFNAFDSTAKLAAHGTKVTLALMKDDGIYRYEADKLVRGAKLAAELGARVLTLEGNHVRILNDADGILSEATAP